MDTNKYQEQDKSTDIIDDTASNPPTPPPKKNNKWYVALIIFLLFLIITSPLLLIYRTIPPYDKTKTHLVVDGDIIEKSPPIVENGEILLPLPIIKEYIDPKVYWDKEQKKVIFTTADKVITMNTDKLTAKVNARPVNLNIPARLEGDTPYIPLQIPEALYKIETNWIPENNVVIIDRQVDSLQMGTVLQKGANIRKKPSIWSPRLAKKLKGGTVLRVFGEDKEWYKVRSETGIIGYVPKKYIQTTQILQPPSPPEGKAGEPWKPAKGKINLVWEYVHSRTPDISKRPKIQGLDVVSPTWFAVTDGAGTVSNKADMRYVELAHKNGYKVWGLFTNSFSKPITHEFLNNSDTREKIIQQMLIYAKLYKLDGINIDFENIYMKDKDMLTQFVREMVPLFREQGLTVSMDVTIRSTSENWSRCYDREALSETVDYMILMAYDQTWGSSPVAGSVAQYPWVEKGLIRVLEQVPHDKLILAMPFYTRLWKEEIVDGNKKVTSKALSMDSIQKLLKEKKVVPHWDEESGQYYAEYMEGKIKYRVWLEDERSLNLKSSLIHKYNLAGGASWRKGFESDNIWPLLNENLKEKKSYEEWLRENKEELKTLE